jgi:hypothetical protein
MQWPYPRDGEDPWYSSFEDMVRAEDASVFALHDEKNIILSGGGVISWDATLNTVTWALPIVLNSSQSGYAETIPTGNLTTVVNDGALGYVLFQPSPQAPVTLVLASADVLPPSEVDSTFVLFRRRQNKLYWRNGQVLNDGDALPIIDAPGGGGGVTAVTALAPINSSGGASPVISLTGIVPVANGGTGLAVPGAVGNVLTSTGAAWVSAPSAGGGTTLLTLDTSLLTLGDVARISGNGVASSANATVIGTARAVGIVHTVGGPGVGKVQPIASYATANFIAGLTLAAGDPVYVSLTSGKLTNNVTGFAPGTVVTEVGIVDDASAYSSPLFLTASVALSIKGTTIV